MKRYISNEKAICLKLFFTTFLVMGMMVLFTACGGQSNEIATDSFSSNSLIGTWVSPSADNQILEIRTEELRFNNRTFDYTVDGNTLQLYQTFPNAGGVAGNMPFELDGDKLTIQLGSDFEGYFYGRSGVVELVRK